MILGHSRDQVARNLAAAAQADADAHALRTDNPHATTAAQAAAIPLAEKGAPGGVATLDADGQVTPAQLFSMPGEHWFGAGPSTTGMVVKSNTNGEAGAWADHTAEATGGGTFAGFPVLTAGARLYVMSPNIPAGLRVVATGAIALGAGSIRCLAWDGAAWKVLPYMATGPAPAYDNRGAAVFSAIASDHIRFGEDNTWAQKLLDGSTGYWLAFEVVAPITTAPTLDSVEVIGNAVKVNDDGVLEYFGAARPHDRLIDTVFEGNGVNAAAPGGSVNSYATGTTLAIESQGVNIQNTYSNGGVNGQVFQPILTRDNDTSCPVTLRAGMRCTVNAGNVELEMNYRGQNVGDLLNGSLSSRWINKIFAVPATANTLHVEQFDLDLHDVAPFLSVPLNFIRDARAGNLDDTAAGNILTTNIRISARKWRE